ncbi:LysM peptidoglycan-binding domain-containing protein [Stigmatella aurantiaca]|uniref:LysM domain-containing protein n=1 Tax=Stigmatella aurantiaca (strain DW4/3-1) TaxID=378806 RepID=Q093B6_STIAD|nr:LysM domain-containing protein [Stigmatella aurantiaca]ADO76115.1 uncharacterized protein STAUR_8361 [Stigmatella aurantiaca DW4/3-1]EAU66838.1 hypothetical protein STIAU_3047 [Stigmatella aurantiaca DW4/3-1]
MIQRHTVRPGESLSTIASKYGIRRWEHIYQYPLNKAFRERTPNASLIRPGDVVIIPDKSPSRQDTPFGDYLEQLFALEEAAIRQQYSFLDRITAFRLIRYPNTPVRQYGGTTLGGGPWPLIIPGAAQVQMPSSWRESPHRERVQFLRDHSNPVIHGAKVDMGHVFAGLDARLRPSRLRLTLTGIPAIEMRSNHEAATYVGDLGSVVAHYGPSAARTLWKKAKVPDLVLQKAYSDWASEEDMLGNIDSYCLPLAPAKTVTQNLLDYYLDPVQGVRKRFSTFLETVRLTQPETRQALDREMFQAALLVLAGDKLMGELYLLFQPSGSMVQVPKTLLYAEAIQWTLEHFTEWCQQRARKE